MQPSIADQLFSGRGAKSVDEVLTGRVNIATSAPQPARVGRGGRPRALPKPPKKSGTLSDQDIINLFVRAGGDPQKVAAFLLTRLPSSSK
jgi:hypothetical protein